LNRWDWTLRRPFFAAFAIVAVLSVSLGYLYITGDVVSVMHPSFIAYNPETGRVMVCLLISSDSIRTPEIVSIRFGDIICEPYNETHLRGGRGGYYPYTLGGDLTFQRGVFRLNARGKGIITVWNLPPIGERASVVFHTSFGNSWSGEIRQGWSGAAEKIHANKMESYSRYAKGISEDQLNASIPYKPHVRKWPPYSEKPYPHPSSNALYLLGLIDMDMTERAREISDFLLWSQYNGSGYSGLVGQGMPEWRYGWPTHDFGWTDAYGYYEKPYEPSHHMDAFVVHALVKFYEVTNETKYLEACYKWYLHQVPFFGWHEDLWRGKEYAWTEYNPTGVQPNGDPYPTDDAVNNVQSKCAMAIAALGYSLQNETVLMNALKLLIYLCKEQGPDGSWVYFGSESSVQRSVAMDEYDLTYMRQQVYEMFEAYSYLLRAGVRDYDVECAIGRGAVYLSMRGFT